MDQRDHGQDVQSVLLGHVPIDLGVADEGIADGAAETSQEAHEAPLLATLGLGLEGVMARRGGPYFWPKAAWTRSAPSFERPDRARILAVMLFTASKTAGSSSPGQSLTGRS